MSKLALVVLLGCIASGLCRAEGPVLWTDGVTGEHNVLPPGRDPCWSEPPDLEGGMGTSEIIDDFALESEIANDFVAGGVITKATWWGGEYGVSVPCSLEWPTPGFNLRFYTDAACRPGVLVADLSITDWSEEVVGCWHGHDPQLKYSADVSVVLQEGTLYWFGAQFKDHTFPGQGGRQPALAVTGCDSSLKSAFFGFPDWTPAYAVFGVPWDASQEFECGATPVERSSWGTIRGMYR